MWSLFQTERHLGIQPQGTCIGSQTCKHLLGDAYVLSRFSHLRLFVTLWTVAHQAPLSMWFSRQEYLLQGIFLNQWLNLHLLYLLNRQVGSLSLAPPGKLLLARRIKLKPGEMLRIDIPWPKIHLQRDWFERISDILHWRTGTIGFNFLNDLGYTSISSNCI